MGHGGVWPGRVEILIVIVLNEIKNFVIYPNRFKADGEGEAMWVLEVGGMGFSGCLFTLKDPGDKA